jgi:hypothetical protein
VDDAVFRRESFLAMLIGFSRTFAPSELSALFSWESLPNPTGF